MLIFSGIFSFFFFLVILLILFFTFFVVLVMDTCTFRKYDKRPAVTVRNTSFNYPRSNASKRQLCIKSVGRLGNNMFIFASAYGIARMKSMQLTLIHSYLFDPLLSVFNITSIPLVYACPNDSIFENSGSKFSPKTITFQNDRDLTLVGYFQSWIYFVNVESELRRIFVFHDRIKEKADGILQTILSDHLNRSPNTSLKHVSFVGIHVRRGDFISKKNTYLGYRTAPADYFHRAMLHFRKHVTNPIFVVCSDDILWSKQTLGHNDTYYVHENLGIDMAVLSRCNHSISSVGTFSWWSAWFTKGIKLYYPYQYKPGSWLETTFSRHLYDYFPFDWIPIT